MPAPQVPCDFLHHSLLGARQLERQDLAHAVGIDGGSVDLRRGGRPAYDPPRPHRAGKGEEFVKSQALMKPAPTLVEGVQDFYSTFFVLGAFRCVEFQQSVREGGEAAALSGRVG
jgi:hypothetical protein